MRFRAFAMVIAATICLVVPNVCKADPTDVATLNLSAAFSCATTSTCGSATGILTGTFDFDLDTESIVGPWSFNTPLGKISSSGLDAITFFSESESLGLPAGLDVLDFQICTDASCSGTLSLQLLFNDTEDFGAIVPASPMSSNGAIFPSGVFSCVPGKCGTVFALTEGTVAPTPELSSLLLLATGLLGAGPFIRRDFARS